MGKKININQHHIDDSVQGVATSCMVSQALIEQLDLPPDVTIQTFYGSIGFYTKGPKGGLRKILSVKNTPEVRAKIKAFDDSRRNVQPFSFDMPLPDDWREQVAAAAKK